jgi:hypothetical protein
MLVLDVAITYKIPYVIYMLIRTRSIRQVGHGTSMDEMRKAAKILIVKPEGIMPFRRPMRR